MYLLTYLLTYLTTYLLPTYLLYKFLHLIQTLQLLIKHLILVHTVCQCLCYGTLIINAPGKIHYYICIIS